MNQKDPGLALSRNSGGSRAANADGAPCKHAVSIAANRRIAKPRAGPSLRTQGTHTVRRFVSAGAQGIFQAMVMAPESAGDALKDHMTAHSRGAMRPGFALDSAPGSQRAQGRPGARCTRGLVCKMVQRTAHEHTGSAETLRPSLRSGLTAYAALSPATNSSCHRHRRINGFAEPGRVRKTSADLTPATGARTTRFCRTLQHRSSACC